MPSRPFPPDCVTLSFAADEQVGIDARWGGPAGVRRASAAHHRLRLAGYPATLSHDELGWSVRLMPLDRNVVSEIVAGFLAATRSRGAAATAQSPTNGSARARAGVKF